MDLSFLSPEQRKRFTLTTNSPSEGKSTHLNPERTSHKILSTAGMVGNYTFTIAIKEPIDHQGNPEFIVEFAHQRTKRKFKLKSDDTIQNTETNKENSFYSPPCNITPTYRNTPTNGKTESVAKILFNSQNINLQRNRKFAKPIVEMISPYNFNVDSSATSPIASPFSKNKPPLNASFSSPLVRRNQSLIPVDNIQLKCIYGEDVRVMTISPDTTFTDLVELVHKDFGTLLRLTYQDEEGDFVQVSNLTEVFLHSHYEGIPKIYLFDPLINKRNLSNRFEIPMNIPDELVFKNKYYLDEFIYQNKNYSLRRGFDISTNKQVTLKFTYSASMFEREKKALQILSTDHTVPCVDIFSDRERSLFCFVLDLECTTNTILSEYIKSKPHRLESKKITKDLTSNLQYLHSQNFVFADLQPMNVAFHNGKWKLINFGCCHQIGELIDVGRLDPIYSSPEVEKVGKGKTKKTKQRNNFLIAAEFPLDIWNLGLILFELHIGKPFRVVFHQIQNLYNNNLKRIEFPSKINNIINDADAIDLLWMILHLDPSKRPSISHILRQSFLNYDEVVLKRSFQNEKNILIQVLNLTKMEFKKTGENSDGIRELQQTVLRATTLDELENLKQEIHSLYLSCEK